MPFDGIDFIRREDPPPAKPSPSENALTILILVLALSLLVFPVSAAGLVDLVAYVRGN